MAKVLSMAEELGSVDIMNVISWAPDMPLEEPGEARGRSAMALVHKTNGKMAVGVLVRN